ncbi:MAG: cytidine deaminase [Ruminococcaceae bacterium]|nr:cytidine deaminase [Oscillospiraceae bacterium]
MKENNVCRTLADAAVKARENAYAPYSKFRVGAAVMGIDGNIYTGCNIENVSYGLTMCAERTAIYKMVSQGCTKFTAIAIAAGEKPTDSAPCGACRQVMGEFCHDINKTLVVMASATGEYIEETLAGILPYPFINFKQEE